MKKNINTKSKEENLLYSDEFKSTLQFEVDYAAIVKGGHFPFYSPNEKKQRLVNEINLLSSKEQKEIVYNLFISKN